MDINDSLETKAGVPTSASFVQAHVAHAETAEVSFTRDGYAIMP